ncbi:MAG: glycosyltransferase 87 family protein, partial [Acetobacteraceae bacterium]
RWLTGMLLGGATLVKFLPAAMVPSFWHRRDWRMPLAGVLTVLVLYAWYIGAGTRVLGFLPRYATEEGISQGSGIWLLAGLGHITRLPMIAVEIYLAVAACFLAGLCAWVIKDHADDIAAVTGHAAILGATTMVVLSPHYAWYYPWLALPCCIRPLRSVIYMSAAGLLLYVNPLNEHFFWPSLVFVPAGVLALLDLRSGGLTPRPGKEALSWARR